MQVFMEYNSTCDVTPELTQEGAEYHGECIPFVSLLCHSFG